jgi:hypothetical protein
MASASNAGSASALTEAPIGSGAPTLTTPVSGRVVSDAILNLSGSKVASGVMSAGYGGMFNGLDYEATATLDFTAGGPENLSLDLLSDKVAGVGFNILQLQVDVDGKTHTYSFTSLNGSAGAEPFFSANKSASVPFLAGVSRFP